MHLASYNYDIYTTVVLALNVLARQLVPLNVVFEATHKMHAFHHLCFHTMGCLPTKIVVACTFNSGGSGGRIF